MSKLADLKEQLRADDVRPVWCRGAETVGTPICTKLDCPSYDGKRCKKLGRQPLDLCLVAVAAMAAALSVPAAREFYILDARATVGNCAVWWRPEGAGYTTELAEAGLYDSTPSDRETDVLVPRAVAERLAVRHVRLDHLREEGVLRG